MNFQAAGQFDYAKLEWKMIQLVIKTALFACSAEVTDAF